MNINVETKYKLGDLVKVNNKDYGVIGGIEIRHTLSGSLIKYTVTYLDPSSGSESWCSESILSPTKVEDTVSIKDV